MELYEFYYYDKFGNFMRAESSDSDYGKKLAQVGSKLATKAQIKAEFKKADDEAKAEAKLIAKLEKEDIAATKARNKKRDAAIKKYPELEGLI